MKENKATDLYKKHLILEENNLIEEAQKALKESSRLGEPMAHHALAYEEFGLENPRTAWALRKYRTAAKKGFAPSAWNLALYYQKVGNIGRYKKWMQTAADLGDPEAAERMATVQAEHIK